MKNSCKNVNDSKTENQETCRRGTIGDHGTMKRASKSTEAEENIVGFAMGEWNHNIFPYSTNNKRFKIVLKIVKMMFNELKEEDSYSENHKSMETYEIGLCLGVYR